MAVAIVFRPHIYKFGPLSHRIGRQLSQLEHKPPVTVALLAANIGIYMFPDMIPLTDNLEAVCLHPARIVTGVLR
jgi:hypothetical protein